MSFLRLVRFLRVFELPAAEKKTRIPRARQAACEAVNVRLKAAMDQAEVELGIALEQANQSYGIAQEEALAEQRRTEIDSLHKQVGARCNAELTPVAFVMVMGTPCYISSGRLCGACFERIAAAMLS